MKTRASFLNWIRATLTEESLKIKRSKFLNIREETYVYDVLAMLSKENPNLGIYITDYIHLENQRYQIMAKPPLETAIATAQIERAIHFCSKTTEKKRNATFVVNPTLSNFLASSTYQWDTITTPNLQPINTNYLFIPSFMDLAPKEVCLTALQAVLLDIKDYKEVFTYSEFLGLMSRTMKIDEKELAAPFLEFMTTQVLYYRTLLPVN